MKGLYKTLRTILLIVLSLLFAVPATLYVLLSLPPVQRDVCSRIESELSRTIAMPVSIGQLALSPFNRATLIDVTVRDARGDTAISVERLGAGLSMRHLLARRLVFTYAELIGLDARLTRDSAGAPLNIQPMIDALRPKDRAKPPTRFEFAVSTVVVRTSALCYDILSQPRRGAGVFDPSHIRVSGLRADVSLPHISNDEYVIDLRRLAAEERCGLALKSLSGKATLRGRVLTVTDPVIEMPASRIALNDQTIDLGMLSDPDRRSSLPVDLAILAGSHISTTDIEHVVSQLDGVDMTLGIEASVKGSPEQLDIARLSLTDGDRLSLLVENGQISDLTAGASKMSFDLPKIELSADARRIAAIASRFSQLSPQAETVAGNLGDIRLDADFSGSPEQGLVKGDFTGAPGGIGINLAYDRRSPGVTLLKGGVETALFDCGKLFAGTTHALSQLGESTAEAAFDVRLRRGNPQGNVDATISKLTYRGHTYTDIKAFADIEGTAFTGKIDIDNPGLMLALDVEADTDPSDRMLNFTVDASEVDLAALNIARNTGGRKLSLSGEGMLHGPDIDNVNGHIYLRDICFTDAGGKGLKLDEFTAEAFSEGSRKEIRLASDLADGTLQGDFSFRTLPAAARSIVEQVFPNLTGYDATQRTAAVAGTDRMQFDLHIKNTAPVEGLVTLPVKIIHPVDINGSLDAATRAVSLSIEAPYLQQGRNVIEQTSLRAGLDAGGEGTGRANLYATSLIPTKHGPMTVAASAFGSDGQLDTQLSWHVSREHRYYGDINTTTRFTRDEEHRLTTLLRFNPSDIVINDTVWTVKPSLVSICGKNVEVDGFNVGRSGQSVKIDGTASTSPDDRLTLALDNIDLDYVFETLGIETAMFGGRATGDFHISSAFTPNPVAYTPRLRVKGLKYNHSLMGDADIRSAWDNRSKAITIDARIDQPNGGISYIDGRILPTKDSLDFTFRADRIAIGFLKPFMSAFATDITGYASGTARLWGTFKLIDMVGDVYGEDVAISLGFTNTTYTTTDSIRLTPGRIDLSDIVIHDKYGKTARLNGWLRHKYFKEPSFSFNITDARDFLVYDVPEKPNERWFGTVYGNGMASVDGHPGFVRIGVDISTAPSSRFTFVLSDAMQASDYNFITFRDRDAARKDSVMTSTDPTPLAVQEIRRRLAGQQQGGSSSIYDMNIKVDVNENALVTLVMDPIGGDRIEARGNGNMRMAYDSANEDLRMFGKYTLARGSYNFTLQDIIIKDFSIEDGSSITFNGNPYAAQLDIKAAYALNANLSDLDESFLQDKELNRTNVPVHALLLVTGDMRAPDIHYDLEFPTLSSDIYRKVRSIINTDEMMSRQIIYLLALNRFYTPEYMSATKGNELVSVASSTISSQLSNMLGQLSDKWSISPNFRSDRGDFSDMEVDVALSSHLLNNRLLINGNLGYRDKALNNNSFIGDFDIEYLLNRRGTIRLKAYNRYNDQNYYVKSALTTQGVGVVFKRDFDSFLSFLRPWLRRRHKAATDTTATAGH